MIRDFDVALIGKEAKDVPDNLWIVDSGVSCHVICKDIGMFDTAYSSSHIVVGGGIKLPIVKGEA